MKCAWFLAALAAVCFTGCGNNSSTSTAAATNTASSGSPLTAPVDYLGAVAKGQQTAEKTVDTTSIQKAIQLFNVEKGRNPKDLNELVQEKYLPRLPEAPYGTKLVYHPETGTVTVEKN